MTPRHAALALLLALAAGSTVRAADAPPEPPETLLLQEPTISARHVVFVYAGDLWIVAREGGEARRLTSGVGRESGPALSPDGRWVAFTGEYEGNADVYALPVEGGLPRRLTWHPERDRVLGWHPDGTRIVLASPRASGPGVDKAFLVPLAGGPVEALALPEVADLAIDPTGARVAYTPWREAFRTWKRYRGGRTSPVWLTDLATLATTSVPHENASDAWPCWMGDTLLFASDRDGVMNVWQADVRGPGRADPASVRRLTAFTDFHVRNLAACADAAVFEQGGALHVLDAKGGPARRLQVRVRSDGLASLPRWQEVKGQVRRGAIAPNGKRVAFEARGEILTLPRDDGDPRNLTQSPGANERDPVWSPDGTRLAWFSDATGEVALWVADANGRGTPKALPLAGAGFAWDPVFSPDGKHVLFSDRTNRLAYVTLATGAVTEVARLSGGFAAVRPAAVWSPDGKWIAYEARDPHTLYDRIALYELAGARSRTVTDGFAAAGTPAFARDGKVLYFSASVDSGPQRFGLDLSSSAAKDGTSSLYLIVLAKDGKNPLFPKSDEGTLKKGAAEGGPKKEKEGEEKPDDGMSPPKDPKEKDDGEKKDEGGAPALPKMTIDLDGIDQRILALPLPARDYGRLACSKDRLLFQEPLDDGGPLLKAFDLDKKKAEEVARGVTSFEVSGDGLSVLVRGPDGWSVMTALGKDKKKLAIEAVKVRVDPAQEWPQILREAWRIQRDFFYDPAMHGVDWPAMWERWSAFLPHVRHRQDLNLLLGELIGELACGHEYVGGGDAPAAPQGVGTGLLGADLEVVDGRWRFARILPGQNWTAGLRAPLTEPGVAVKAGDYLLAVDGRPLLGTQNLLEAFENTADRQVELSVNASPSADGARTVRVVPVASDRDLRRRAWVEENRRRVDALSGGQLAYVYMPDTGNRGLEAFTRDYFSQLDRKGLVLDERYNGGGKVADYVIDLLGQDVRCWWMSRDGWAGRTPFGVLQGPKVMLINGYAGSGGDAMPWMFREARLGTLVGTRTWGGLVGITGYPPLMDGGSVTAAAFGIMDREGRWVVENVGVAPDVEVLETPAACADGHDPTLEKGVALALEALAKTPRLPRPVYAPPAKR